MAARLAPTACVLVLASPRVCPSASARATSRGAEAAAAADPVLDHELLAQALAEFLRDQASHGVGAASGP